MLEQVKERFAAIDWNTAVAVLVIVMIVIPILVGAVRKVA